MAANSEFFMDIMQPRYRFAYEVVKEVNVIRGNTRLARLSYPPARKTLFTEEHADLLQIHLVNDRKAQDLDLWIAGNATDYSLGQLKHLMDFIKNGYKDNIYIDEHQSAHDFICACAEIAYTAAYFSKKNEQAQNTAVMYLTEWISEVPEDSYIFAYRGAPQRA